MRGAESSVPAKASRKRNGISGIAGIPGGNNILGYHDAPIVKHQQLCTATTPSKVQVRQIHHHFALNTSSDECIPWLVGVRYAFSRLVVSTPYKNAWCLLRCLIELLLCFQDPNQRHKRNLYTQIAHTQCLNHLIGPIFDLWSRASVY